MNLDASPPENLPAGAALPTSVALPAGARDQDEVGRRNSVGKAKGKGKKSDSSPPTESDLEVTKSAADVSLYNKPLSGCCSLDKQHFRV